jgi:hypothetical protein
MEYVMIVLFIAIMIGLLALNFNKLKEYDERQLAIRGRGYSYAYFTVMILSILYVSTKNIISVPISSELISVIILLISVIVFITYTIFNDAYGSYKYNNYKKLFILYIIMFLLNLVYLRSSIVNHTLIKNGLLLFREGMDLVLSIFFLILILNLVIKLLVDRCKKDEE